MAEDQRDRLRADYFVAMRSWEMSEEQILSRIANKYATTVDEIKQITD
jgi:hypothetical protein